MCFAPQRACNFFISHLASWLRTRRFSEPTFSTLRSLKSLENTVFCDFPTFSRICIFFLLTLSLLSSALFCSSLLSASSHLCFFICPSKTSFDDYYCYYYCYSSYSLFIIVYYVIYIYIYLSIYHYIHIYIVNCILSMCVLSLMCKNILPGGSRLTVAGKSLEVKQNPEKM